jgi:hypothetical protein
MEEKEKINLFLFPKTNVEENEMKKQGYNPYLQ